ncbi:MAG: DNA-binding response regulator [Comamonadaceae bacterium]|nr:DNA-binding response regulator [Comamonadaceae bacterium]
MPMYLLIVEDDDRVADFLRRGLAAEGYSTQRVANAEEALLRLRQHPCALLLLDLMLPGMSGIELCQRLRAERLQMPVLMLTALDGVEDRVQGLRCGADDYLGKPFAFDELLARIEALLRRPTALAQAARTLEVADLLFDRDQMQCWRAGRALNLTAKELALLELLMSAPGRVYSRERILANVWGSYEDPLTNVVEVYIRRLRAKIDDGHELALIKTVRGLGYRLDAAATPTGSGLQAAG